ncbi:type I restriction enzyme HsdR N-terminal domain-containing protein [Aquirufa sp. HETE-83D]|uniref:Type I restriction enzyme HsdR N-terminal domain-containing protein n=1 Tax=Aquirufa esocilacus TaxID=3096513 RepID=A0ABW6DFL4_9BACT
MITSPEINLVFPAYSYKVKKNEGKLYIFEEISKKYRLLTPEEWVRQHCLHYLVNYLKYPASLFQIEGGMKVDKLNRRTDIRIYKSTGEVFMLIECKAPQVDISLTTLQQISQYQKTQKAEYLVITNGLQNTILHHSTKTINEFPPYL